MTDIREPWTRQGIFQVIVLNIFRGPADKKKFGNPCTIPLMIHTNYGTRFNIQNIWITYIFLETWHLENVKIFVEAQKRDYKKTLLDRTNISTFIPRAIKAEWYVATQSCRKNWNYFIFWQIGGWFIWICTIWVIYLCMICFCPSDRLYEP